LVLVPGAWHSASGWDVVISHLPGAEARAVSLPSHGAAASGLGDNLRRAHRVAEQFVAGGTMLNGAPNIHSQRAFGGLGLSGFGKEGGPEGLAEFLRVKMIAIA
jgi:acyl-CoA reductase-like NAD-dependent aldehyde dehydrogenase